MKMEKRLREGVCGGYKPTRDEKEEKCDIRFRKGLFRFWAQENYHKAPPLISPLYEVNPNFLLNLHISYFIQI